MGEKNYNSDSYWQMPFETNQLAHLGAENTEVSRSTRGGRDWTDVGMKVSKGKRKANNP